MPNFAQMSCQNLSESAWIQDYATVYPNLLVELQLRIEQLLSVWCEWVDIPLNTMTHSQCECSIPDPVAVRYFRESAARSQLMRMLPRLLPVKAHCIEKTNYLHLNERLSNLP